MESVKELESIWQSLLHTWREQRLYQCFLSLLKEEEIDDAYEVLCLFEECCPEQPQVITAMFRCLEEYEEKREYYGSYVLLSKKEWKRIRNIQVRMKDAKITPWISEKKQKSGWRVPVTVRVLESDAIGWSLMNVYGEEACENAVYVEANGEENGVILCDEVGTECDYTLLVSVKDAAKTGFVSGLLHCFETAGDEDFEVTRVMVGINLKER